MQRVDPVAERPAVAILCGGRGTRLRSGARAVPKPLVEIGGRPILWHVIQIYRAQGFTDFVLLTGYRAEAIADFAAAVQWPAGTNVRCLDTGVDTPTGGRLHRARATLQASPFCLTYADGVADIDLPVLLAEHRASGAAATMTVVQPELPFGVADLDADGTVRGFVEKPRTDAWINGGFFCLQPDVLGLVGPESVFEREPLERLAAAGSLRAHRHTGFWACMDTYKDASALNDLWKGGNPPWKLWS